MTAVTARTFEDRQRADRARTAAYSAAPATLPSPQEERRTDVRTVARDKSRRQAYSAIGQDDDE